MKSQVCTIDSSIIQKIVTIKALFLLVFALGYFNTSYSQDTERIYHTNFNPNDISKDYWIIGGSDPEGQVSEHYWAPVRSGYQPESCAANQRGPQATAGYRVSRLGTHSLYVSGSSPSCGELRPVRPAGLNTSAFFMMAAYLEERNIDLDGYEKIVVTFDLKVPGMAAGGRFSGSDGDVFKVEHSGIGMTEQTAELNFLKYDRSESDLVYESVGHEVTRDLIEEKIHIEEFQMAMQPNSLDLDEKIRATDSWNWQIVRFEVPPHEINDVLVFKFSGIDEEPYVNRFSDDLLQTQVLFEDEGVYIDNLLIEGSKEPQEQSEEEESDSPWGNWNR